MRRQSWPPPLWQMHVRRVFKLNLGCLFSNGRGGPLLQPAQLLKRCGVTHGTAQGISIQQDMATILLGGLLD